MALTVQIDFRTREVEQVILVSCTCRKRGSVAVSAHAETIVRYGLTRMKRTRARPSGVKLASYRNGEGIIMFSPPDDSQSYSLRQPLANAAMAASRVAAYP